MEKSYEWKNKNTDGMKRTKTYFVVFEGISLLEVG